MISSERDDMFTFSKSMSINKYLEAIVRTL